MSSDSFGFGYCVAGTDRGWPCSEAAIGEDRLCRWHFKLSPDPPKNIADHPYGTERDGVPLSPRRGT
jgi:hypothetical protein